MRTFDASQGALAAEFRDGGRVLLLWLDDQGCIAGGNSFFEQVTGWRLEEVRGRDWVSIRDGCPVASGGTRANGTVVRIVTHAGTERAIEWHAEGRFPSGALVVGVDVTDRLRLEANLQAREQDLRRCRLQLAETQQRGRIGSWEIGADASEPTWSEEMYRILDLPPAQKAGLREAFLSRVHPEDQRRSLECVAHPFGTHDVIEESARLMMPDGGIKYVRLRARRMKDESATSDAGTIIGMLEDVTGRVPVDGALLGGEQHFEALIHTSPVGMFMINLRGEVTFVNRRWCEITGLHPQDAGWWMAVLHPDDRVREEAERRRAISERRGFRFEYRIAGKGGGETWVLGQAEPLLGPSGALQGYVGSITDVTDVRQAQESARRNAARLIEAQRIAKVGSWEFDVAQNVLIWSDEVFRIFEVDPSKFGASYEAFLAMVHPDDREMVDTAYQRSLETKVPYAVVHRLLMSGGRVKYVHEECETLFDASGNPIRSVGTVHDITSQIRAERNLRRTLEGIFAFVGLFDLAGTLIEVNRAPLTQLGVEKEDIVGKPLWEAHGFSYSEETQAQVRTALARAAHGSIARDDYRIRVGENQFRLIDIMFGPLFDESGRIEGVVGSGIDITEREHVKEILRTHSQVLMSMGEGVHFVDASGTIRFVNPALEAMFGYEPGELVGKHVTVLNDSTDVESAARNAETIIAALRARSRWEGEINCGRKDGSVFCCHIKVTPMERVSEILWVSIHTDVTERRLAEEKRAAADHRYRLLVENAPYCIHEIDREGRLLSVNAAGLRMLGEASEHDVRGRPYLASVVEADRPRVAALLHEALQGVSSEFEFDSPRGQRLRSTFVPLLDAQGRIDRLMGVTVDETERVRSTENARRTSDLLRRVIDSSPDWICVKDTNHRFLLVNKAFAAAQRSEPKQMIGYRDADFFSDETCEGRPTERVRGTRQDCDEALAGRIVHNPDEARTTISGETRRFDTFRAPLRDEHDRVYGVLSYARDVTEQHAVTEAQKRSLEEKDVLLREIHHRVKNNMQIVSSLLNLQSAATADPLTRTMLGEARERIQSIALVHELLYRSKSFTALDIGAHLGAIADMLLAPHEHTLAVARSFEDTPVLVGIDTAIPLGLIANELLSNALKHAVTGRPHAHVDVAFHRKDGGIEFVVTDDGRGLPEGFRVDAVRSLGLRIVTALVRQVGGRLSLQSGPGTTATVWVPNASSAPPTF